MKTTNNNKKAMVVAAGIAIAVAVSIAGLVLQSPSLALAQQLALPNNSNTSTSSSNTTTATIPQPINITGSVNIFKIIKDNVKVSFTDAASTAEKQVSGGTIVGGHLGVVQGYLVYRFEIVNTTNNTLHLVIVDAGNDNVLHTSQGYPLGIFAGGVGGHRFEFGEQQQYWHHRDMW
jgi:hypothetical protein